MDERDRKILDLLQRDATMAVAAIADAVALSASAVSRRIQRLEEEGFVARRVAILDRAAMRLPTTIFVIVKTSHHSADWLDAFRAAVTAIPEIVEVHRLTGNFDYILKIVLPDVEHYDLGRYAHGFGYSISSPRKWPSELLEQMDDGYAPELCTYQPSSRRRDAIFQSSAEQRI